MQYLLVMRHTKREDEVNESWVTAASHPWDPPICEQGVELVSNIPTCRNWYSALCTTMDLQDAQCASLGVQVEETAGRLQTHGITKVVTSPFKRCLQTGQIACKALNLPSNAIEVDWKLSEVRHQPSTPAIASQSL
jgi:hypothetical protein